MGGESGRRSDVESVAPAAAFRWGGEMAIEWIVAAVLAAMFATWCLSAWWWWP